MSRVIKWVLIAIFGGAGLLIGSLMAFYGLVSWSTSGTGIDGGVGSWVMRSLFHDGPRYFRFTVNLEVEGAPVVIDRVIECDPYFAHRMGRYFQKRWYLVNEAMTHRLPDDSGVIVVVPKICEDFAVREPAEGWEWRAFPDLPDDFVPMVLWTHDADNPQELEAYHSFDSLERPGARVQFRSAVLENSPDLEPAVSEEEFGSWTNAYFGGLRLADRKPTYNNYVGTYLVVLREADWRSVPELNAALGKSADSHFLEPALQGLFLQHFQMPAMSVKYALEGNLAPRRRHHTDRYQVSARAILDHLHPLERRDGTLVEQAGRPGIILYQRSLPQTGGKADARVIIAGSPVVWPHAKRYQLYYSSRTKSVYRIDNSYLEFHTAKQNPAGE